MDPTSRKIRKLIRQLNATRKAWKPQRKEQDYHRGRVDGARNAIKLLNNSLPKKYRYPKEMFDLTGF